jgi:hypothetical protein
VPYKAEKEFAFSSFDILMVYNLRTYPRYGHGSGCSCLNSLSCHCTIAISPTVRGLRHKVARLQGMSSVTEPTSLLSDQILTLFDIDVGFGSSKDFDTPVATGRVAPNASFLGKLLVGTRSMHWSLFRRLFIFSGLVWRNFLL